LGLSSTVLSNLADIRRQFLCRLVDAGFATAERDGGELVNCRQADLNIVRCVICAGLSPNVVQVQEISKSKNRDGVILVSREKDRCVAHPCSLISRQTHKLTGNNEWLLCHDKVFTSQLFLQGSTLIGSIGVLLFGGELMASTRTRLSIDGMHFETGDESVAVLLKLLRREIDSHIMQRLARPSADLAEHAELLMLTVTKVMQLEGHCFVGSEQT
jgi:hypothetical protein